jgi:hypothetical protein
MAWTEQQLKDAARKALAAGDTAAAKRLIAEARKAGGQSLVTPQAAVPPPAEAQPQAARQPTQSELARGLSDADRASLDKAGNPYAQDDTMYDPMTGMPIAGSFTNTPMTTPMSALESLGVGAGQAATFGFGDEIKSGVRAALDPSKTYSDYMGEEASRIKDAQDSGGYGVGQFVGALAPGAIGARLISGGTTLLGQVGRGALAGAGGGAVAGAGSADMGLGNRIAGAGVGGALGGVIGAGVPVVGAAVGGGVRAIAELLANRAAASRAAKGLGVGPKAGRVLNDLVEMDDPAAMTAALEKAGPNAMLAEASPGLQSALDASMRSPGQAARIAGPRIDERFGGALKDFTDEADWALGDARGFSKLQEGMRKETAAERQKLYEAAFDQEIDWRSPAGERLRGLIETTPPEVVSKAMRVRSMAERPKGVPDSAFPEFADKVESKPGPQAYSALDEERTAVGKFFDDYRYAKTMAGGKAPLTYGIKRKGGIDPRSPAAADLYAMGVTPRSAPGLFRYGGMKDLDNLEWTDDFPAEYRAMIGENENYIPRQVIIDGLAAEKFGAPQFGASAQTYADDLPGMEAALPEFTKRRLALKAAELSFPTAPKVTGDKIPMKTFGDADAIKRALDDIERTNDGLGAMAGKTEFGMEAGKRAREIRDALIEINPAYKAALDAAQYTIKSVEGVKTGYNDFLSSTFTREMAEEAVSTGNKFAIAKGVRQKVDDLLASAKQAVTDVSGDPAQAKKIYDSLSSPAARAKMKTLVGPAWEGLEKKIDEVGSILGLRARTSPNSATFGRMSADKAIDDAIEPSALRRGRPLEGAKEIIATMLGASKPAVNRMRADVKAELADVLTRPGQGAAIQKILEDLVKNKTIPATSGAGIRKAIETLLLSQGQQAPSGATTALGLRQ